ncbi:hypothetical protein LAC81_37815 (plasmid) [Ensifer adhaerens]|uniref:hypothetical protein n=1 Tax=Ensifer adhaerens TaxID=106592 RepID=UPI001CBAAFC0|nr:hypothetical protein [Ensifer adhaerens]MBZ7927696.1 hypothetical protein [Ensifer adhaerens]UAX98091.1 hypothetical protein LAC78_39115 [Ensifer adhaerens]UAY05472.1 hypothetical protein LAC80_37830 [Ensifer adhaerens]UAY12850.1 hypothetical protein LAC81_37815 [Ensifer adhaerens]
MDDDRTPITAQFQSFDVNIVSRKPLIGSLGLTALTGHNIELRLDQNSAKALLLALAAFLAQNIDDRQIVPDDYGGIVFNNRRTLN